MMRNNSSQWSGGQSALAGATLTGGALAWANWLLDVGAHL